MDTKYFFYKKLFDGVNGVAEEKKENTIKLICNNPQTSCSVESYLLNIVRKNPDGVRFEDLKNILKNDENHIFLFFVSGGKKIFFNEKTIDYYISNLLMNDIQKLKIENKIYENNELLFACWY